MSVEAIWRALENIIDGNPVDMPSKGGGKKDPNKPSDISMIVSGLLGSKSIESDATRNAKKAPPANEAPSQAAKEAAMEGDAAGNATAASQMADATGTAAGAKKGGGLFSILGKMLGGII